MNDMLPNPPKSASGEQLPFRGYRLAEVLPALQRIAGDDFRDWTWCRNMACKYVSVHIDTRGGGFVTLKDRDGNSLTLDELERQSK